MSLEDARARRARWRQMREQKRPCPSTVEHNIERVLADVARNTLLTMMDGGRNTPVRDEYAAHYQNGVDAMSKPRGKD